MLTRKFLDLGTAPPSNAYLTESQLKLEEEYFPLRLLVCERCWLVQTEDYAGRAILFSESYAYTSSVSTTWLGHAKNYVLDMITRFDLTNESTVVEIAANDGYLLQYVTEEGIPCYGVEPTRSTASLARSKGIEIIEEFFGSSLAKSLRKERGSAELVVANNVLAHVPDINDFALGVYELLKPGGVVTFEFQYLLKMVQYKQFDTAYHEHYSYLSFTSVLRILDKVGLEVFDVEELSTHGGSLRVFAHRRSDSPLRQVSQSVNRLRGTELMAGIETLAYYSGFQEAAEQIKAQLLRFLTHAKIEGKSVVAYGAAAKGNTLINFSGITTDLLAFVCDASPAKQGKYLPGSRIPIYAPKVLIDLKPDYVLILPWNIAPEIRSQLSVINDWGGRFVTAVPELKVNSA